MDKVLKYIFFILICILPSISTEADDLENFMALKGKTVFFPSYSEGKTDFPFVFTKDCFYTGKDSKKFRVNETIIGKPITIQDVTIKNLGKSSEKLCVLFSKDDGNSYSLVIPMQVPDLNDNILIFSGLFYHAYIEHPYTSSPFRFVYQKIRCFCYDYPKIKQIEDNYKGKSIAEDLIGNRRDDIILSKGEIFNGFKIISGPGPSDLDAHSWDILYAIFSNGNKEHQVMVAPIGIDKTGGILDDRWVGYGTLVTLDDIEEHLK